MRTLTIDILAECGQVVLTIADSGTGIAPGNLKRIFQPFFTTKSPHSGTGLGLSVCVSIVEQHGGTISVRNRPEGGAEFAVRLPLLGSPGAGPQPATGAASVPRLRLAGAVLIVEDEDPVTRLVQEILLKHCDCEIVCAANGAEALDLCALRRFTCIVSDLCMPVMNGMDFFDHLLSGNPEQCERLVFMSGYESDLQYRDRLAAAGRPVLAKPFAAPDLVRMLHAFAQPD